MTEPSSTQQDENRLIAERRVKLDAIRRERNAFPNDFRRDAHADELQREHAHEQVVIGADGRQRAGLLDEDNGRMRSISLRRAAGNRKAGEGCATAAGRFDAARVG